MGQIKGQAPVQSVAGKTGSVALAKGDVGLSLVDNTADADKPISTATQTALNSKQSTLVSGTNIKTVNSTSLLGSGDVAVQETLVSGVSIKTVNSTSLLGAGDIPIPIVNPSGVAGAIQFTDGSAFASDAANLFWDDANNRLGIGTNAPTKELTIDANSTDGGLIIRSQNDSTLFQVTKDGTSANTCELFQFSGGAINFAIRSAVNPSYFNNGTFTFGATTNLGAKVNIKGSGSTPATTALLVQNSAGTDLFRLQDDGRITTKLDVFNFQNTSSVTRATFDTFFGRFAFGNGTIEASAVVAMNDTTRGFLPPRMTTTQKNAIASPAAGLVVYDTTLNKLCVYTTAWETITSL